MQKFSFCPLFDSKPSFSIGLNPDLSHKKIPEISPTKKMNPKKKLCLVINPLEEAENPQESEKIPSLTKTLHLLTWHNFVAPLLLRRKKKKYSSPRLLIHKLKPILAKTQNNKLPKYAEIHWKFITRETTDEYGY